MTRLHRFIWLSVSVFLLFFSTSSPAAENYKGAWERKAHYLNGNLAGTEPASLVITDGAFNSVVLAPPEKACGFSATLSVAGSQMNIKVAVSSCPSDIPAETEITYTFQVNQEGLTLTHSLPEGLVKEIYVRRNSGTGSGTSSPEICTHPYCGTWLRTATSVGGELVHNEPSTAVITDKTYWAVAAACYNLLDIMSVKGNQVLLKMVRHNCPTPAGFMPPGHLVPGTWKLTQNGKKLSIIDTNYGVAVTTDFKRLK